MIFSQLQRTIEDSLQQLGSDQRFETDACDEELPSWLPSEDLTRSARSGRLTAAVTLPQEAGLYRKIAQALYRQSSGNVLITGLKGVGKTTCVREFARRASAGEYPFLRDSRFVWFDLRDVPPEESPHCLQALLEQSSRHENLVLCLDGLSAMLKSQHGTDNKPVLRSALAGRRVQVIGLMSTCDYNDLIAGDAEMLELFTQVEIEQPNEEQTFEILSAVAQQLSRRYTLQIDRSVVSRIVTLTSNYVLGEPFPAKAVKVLVRCCEHVDFSRSQLGDTRSALLVDDVIHAISEITGIPTETLAGGGSAEHDLERILNSAVVGQTPAISQVASELRLIKGGVTEPGKPASVMLFAGTTGVGKTELAKRVAELFSTTKRLNVYTMGNFSEPHSVSGIIGVPPGYVGHEQGGRLINELNADPYAVFLLDEADKAHPDVWKPFLNLFDEGWIVDQRGVKAYADRAIFILTTNVGADSISQMVESGKSVDEIEDRVKHTLSRIRHERSSQCVFSSHFLARLKRVVVFQQLDGEAMLGIAQKMIRQMQSLWLRKREKEIVIADEEIVMALGEKSHRLNHQSSGREGGRIVKKLMTRYIESKIQSEALSRCRDYQQASRIIVGVSGASKPAGREASLEHIEVKFE